MDDKLKQIKNVIIYGKDEVLKKRQLEVAPKIRKLVEDYMKLTKENKVIFDMYHNSFYKNEGDGSVPDIINYFGNGMNELELNEFDLDLIIDDKTNMTLLDFILKYKPDLRENNFSLGGSYTEIGIKFLEKILISGDKEYIKYLHEIGFNGSPELYLIEINGKKVIDYLIENYDEYNNFCGIEFNLKIKDISTKEYILNNVQNGKYDIINEKSINEDRLFKVLDIVDFNIEDLSKQIVINGIKTNIIELYLTKDILKGRETLINAIVPYYIVNCLIQKLFETDNEQLKSEIVDCLNNLYIDEITLEKLDSDDLKMIGEYGISLKIKKEETYKDDDELFLKKINELAIALKEGIPTSEELINYAINNYVNLYKSGIPFVLKEVETIILIKKNNPKFHLEDSSVGPNFDNDTVHLVLSDKSSLGYHGEDNYATFNHEITHAIQYYCYNDNTPSDYYHTLPDKKMIVDSIAKYCVEVMDKMENTIVSEKFQKSYPNLDNNEEIRQRQIYYISTNIFGYEREVIDIFDTILCFTENLSKLGIENADFIEGHPVDYMKYGGYDFSEMLADYKSVMCSGRVDLINFVKSNLPIECVSFIEKFYMDILTNYTSLYTNYNSIFNNHKNRNL